ncbi:50S ribosomal protein L30 [Desulfovibrio inopinatus]|uniref:50S ribosomal protein L30 n=1 Tax=Desulfovibrio inopinatus TaxID=102109 RepID=UPI00042A3566|nr:50S ribosomal protein L30 [Desulfovibrio inopinatus]
MSATIKVKLVRSKIGCTPKQRKTLAAMGLRSIRQVKELPNTSAVQGMVEKVKHLVEVEAS